VPANKQIIIAHYTLPPVVGGVESMIISQAEIFARNDYLVTLLSGYGKIEGKNIKTSQILEFNPEHYRIHQMQSVMLKGALPESYELKVQQLLKRIETEVGYISEIIIHNMMTMPLNLAATEAWWLFIQKHPEKKFFIWTHDLAWLMEDYSEYRYNRTPWSLLQTKLPEVHYVTVSEFRRAQLAKLMNIPLKQISVVPNVIKLQDFFRFHTATEKIIQMLKLTDRYPFILIPARVLPRKNLERSIQIIAALRKQFPGILGLIAGSPYTQEQSFNEYTKQLFKHIREHQLEHHVQFLSQIMDDLKIDQNLNHEIVRDLYFVSHLVMLMSKDEGFGLPILEAGVCRVPLVVSKILVFEEIAADNVIYLSLDDSIVYEANQLADFLSRRRSKADKLFVKIYNEYNWENYWLVYFNPLFGTDK
jgi:glycosyltransferase involved in cell wall biosynthesis